MFFHPIGVSLVEIFSDVNIIFFYFILGTITSCHSAQRSVIHLTICKSLGEHMPSGECSIKITV